MQAGAVGECSNFCLITRVVPFNNGLIKLSSSWAAPMPGDTGEVATVLEAPVACT